jgi:uncharacterized membrane protein YjfL (UPF0719 family)
MSADETFVLMFGLVVAVYTWFLWFRDLLIVTGGRSGSLGRLILRGMPFVCALILFQVLRRFASSDVRDDALYFAFYLVLGAAWVGLGTKALAFCDLSARDDVVERGNRAAVPAIAGGLLAITFCFAGGNVGEGPGWSVVLFCGVLSTGTLLLAWKLLNRLTQATDAITVDRDVAAGVRVAGFFVGAGLILGRAVAGDWKSTGATLFDFGRTGWPVILLLAVAVLIESKLRPSPEAPERPVLTGGVLPFLVYAGIGVAALEQAGPWR